MLSPRYHDTSELPHGHPCRGCPVRDFAVCGILETDELRGFRRLGCSLALNAGETLFHQGAPALSVFTVTEGALKSYKILADGRRQVVGFHLPGDFLGASVDDTHAFAAEALEASRLCAFPQRRFDDFVGDHPPMERELYIAAAHELADARQQMVLLGRKTAIERIASFFFALSRPVGDAYVVDLPMSRSDIADYLGVTKETVSRTLTELKNMRLLRLRAMNCIELLDRARLEAIAGDDEGGRKAA